MKQVCIGLVIAISLGACVAGETSDERLDVAVQCDGNELLLRVDGAEHELTVDEADALSSCTETRGAPTSSLISGCTTEWISGCVSWSSGSGCTEYWECAVHTCPESHNDYRCYLRGTF